MPKYCVLCSVINQKSETHGKISKLSVLSQKELATNIFFRYCIRELNNYCKMVHTQFVVNKDETKGYHAFPEWTFEEMQQRRLVSATGVS
jgi:hypothetical protein